jgi:predicted flap endonuclease-1-like 5' DNA nuclease
MGDEFDLPPGVDWLRAGLVEKIGPAESAMLPAAGPKPEGRGLRPVTEISGIGAAMADQLEAVNINTIADLAAAHAGHLTWIRGISTAMAFRFIEAAREELR